MSEAGERVAQEADYVLSEVAGYVKEQLPDVRLIEVKPGYGGEWTWRVYRRSDEGWEGGIISNS